MICPGYTDDVLEYIRVSVAKTMLADIKDSVRNNRTLNIQDKYGASAVSCVRGAWSHCGLDTTVNGQCLKPQVVFGKCI